MAQAAGFGMEGRRKARNLKKGISYLLGGICEMGGIHPLRSVRFVWFGIFFPN